MSIAQRSFSGIIYGVIQFALTFLQSIIFVPFILSYWSKEKYGLWLTCYAFISLMRTLDSGHQNYIGNEFMKWYHTDIEKAKALLGSSLRVALIIGLVELLIFLVAILFGFEKILLGLESNVYLNIGIVYMLIMWWLVGSIGGIIVKIILPIGLFNRTMFWGIVNRLLEIIVLILAVCYNWEVGFIFGVLALCLFIYSLVVLYDIKQKLPSLYPWWQYGSFKQGIKGFTTSLVLTFNSFIEQFSTNGLLILIGNLASTALIPSFTTLRTASNVFLQVNQITINPLIPDIVRFHTLNQKNKITAIFNLNWFSLNFLLIFPILTVLPLLPNLYESWTRHQLPFDKLLSYSLMFSIVIVAYGRVTMSYLSSINHFKSLLSTNIVRVVFLFPMSYYSIKFLGLSYIGIPICVSELFASILLPAYFAKKELSTDFNIQDYCIMLLSAIFLFLFMLIQYMEWLSLVKLYLLSVSCFMLIALYQWRTIPNYIKQSIFRHFKIDKYFIKYPL